MSAEEFQFEDAAEFSSALPRYIEDVKSLADLTTLWGQFQPDLRRLKGSDRTAFADAIALKDARKRELEQEGARELEQREAA